MFRTPFVPVFTVSLPAFRGWLTSGCSFWAPLCFYLGLMPSLSRRNAERGERGPGQGRGWHRAPMGSLGSTMVIYGLARGGSAPWHPVRLSWPLALPAAIFKEPGLHPKYSGLYFWCKMIFLGRGCGEGFFFFCMKLMGLEAGREKQLGTAGKKGQGKAGRAGWWP